MRSSRDSAGAERRAYAPALGRFAQPDPILHGGGMNLYAYVGNDPVNFVDPLGLRGCWVGPEGEPPVFVECGGPPDWSSSSNWLADWLGQNGGLALLNRLENEAAARVAAMELVGPRGGGEEQIDTPPILDPLGVARLCQIPPDELGFGYADLNLSFGSRRILGATSGAMIDLQTGDIFAYLGGGAVSPGVSASATRSFDSRPTEGWNVAAQVNMAAMSGSWGQSWGSNPGPFSEVGLGTPGVSATAFYSWKIGNLCENGGRG